MVNEYLFYVTRTIFHFSFTFLYQIQLGTRRKEQTIDKEFLFLFNSFFVL